MQMKELIKGIEIIEAPQEIPNIDIQHIQYNSQKIKSGDLFVAIKGFTTDGHKYIQDAIERGAAAVFVTEKQEGLSIPQFVTEDNRKALAQLSANYYDHPGRALKTIGITASNGKTTTAKLLAEILRTHGEKTAIVGTVNYEYGEVSIESKLTTPESLELQGMMREMVDLGMENMVTEVSSQASEQKRTFGIPFKQVALNNITREHIDQHGTFEEYFRQKSKLITEAPQDTEVVLNADDEYSIGLKKNRPDAYVFGHYAEDVDVKADDLDLSTGFANFKVTLSPRMQTRCKLEENQFDVQLRVAGYHMVPNSLSAITLALLHGVSVQSIQLACVSYTGVERRFERIYDGPFTILDDHFANAGNIRVSLTTLDFMEYKDLILVYAIRGNRGVTVNRENVEEFAPQLKKLRAKKVIATTSQDVVEEHDIVSDDERTVFQQCMDDNKCTYEMVDSLEEAVITALDSAEEGDVILLAGCQGMDAGGRLLLQEMAKRDPNHEEELMAPVANRITGH